MVDSRVSGSSRIHLVGTLVAEIKVNMVNFNF